MNFLTLRVKVLGASSACDFQIEKEKCKNKLKSNL
jgi:hypothetical protein